MQPSNSSNGISATSARRTSHPNGIHASNGGAGSNGSNGYHANGNSHSALDGEATVHDSSYGSPVAGPSKPSFLRPGSTIDREELVRLTLQCLNDIGYSQAAAALSRESGFSLEPPNITAFRSGVLDGKWETVSRLLRDENIAQGPSLETVRFLIAEQRFLEYLEARDHKKALSILRNELAPLNQDSDRLQQLSSLMMSAGPADLRERSGWTGTGDQSRRVLLDAIQRHIPSGVMVPQRRLETLLEQAKIYQRSQCRYHTSNPAISLYTDHVCDKTVFPTQTTHILGGHDDQVWRVQFSHNGRYLATTSKDGTSLVWQVTDGFSLLHTLHAAEPMELICAMAWSPDDTMILYGVEHSLKVFDIATGMCTLNTAGAGHTDHAVGGVAWMPDSKSFMSGGLDGRIFCWDLDGNGLYGFTTYPTRIVDLAVSPDGSRLVALGESTYINHATRSAAAASAANGATPYDARAPIFEHKDRRVLIFNLHERRQERNIPHTSILSCVTFAAGDSRHALINHAPNELLLYDVIDGTVEKRYRGQIQERDLIRSTIGGTTSGFVISGSEDSMVYVWHRDHKEPLERLPGHTGGSVNDISWNPAHPAMFASAGDDKTVRIWQAPASASS